MFSQTPLPISRTHLPGGMESLHPDIWRASQLAHDNHATLSSGYVALNKELPNGGWPLGQLIEILVAQAATTEIKLLLPALRNLGSRPVALLAPPHIPLACAYQTETSMNIPLLWIASAKHIDSLWAAEQILKNGSCGALLFWQTQIKTEALRRLHLIAQKSQTLFVVIRPLQAAQSPSPAVLRLALKPQASGIQVDILKRRGAVSDTPLFLYLNNHPYLTLRSTEYTHPDKINRFGKDVDFLSSLKNELSKEAAKDLHSSAGVK
ncbi:translesion DNA synthesis-associated protein ImuA [Undibacterium sp. Ji67W]|uniref:translesion DNA synthesis-associated protein ImuA n=1 Tax=Undibacterium sp. Ji67W TaxID=3413042 RepID=UPI003BF32F45